jgi:hypothetical protein
MLISRVENEDAVVVDVTAEWLAMDEEGEGLSASALEVRPSNLNLRNPC